MSVDRIPNSLSFLFLVSRIDNLVLLVRHLKQWWTSSVGIEECAYLAADDLVPILPMCLSRAAELMQTHLQAFLCPGARISGCCRIGEYALVGSNATLHPRTEMGGRAVVGASSLAQRLGRTGYHRSGAF
jgi:hypothetical protein